MALLIRRTNSILLLLVITLLPFVIAFLYLNPAPTPSDPQFEEGDIIPLFANTVSPRSRHCEKSPYFHLPFCPPGDPIPNRKKSLDEIMAGDCFARTRYEIKFKVNSLGKILCEKNLTVDEVRKFRDAVREEYEYQMSFNNFIFRGIVGEVDPIYNRSYLVKHIDFYPQYYKNQVVKISSKSDFTSWFDITEDGRIGVNFTYSVYWNEFIPNLRNSNLLDGTAVETEKTQWIDYVLLFFWIGLFVLLTTFCEKYYSFWFRFQEASQQVHGRACSRPRYPLSLGAILGIGTQNLITICFLLVKIYNGDLYTCIPPGSLAAILLLMSSVTSAFAGLIATSFHRRYISYEDWIQSVFQTGFIFIITVCMSVMVVYTMEKSIFGYFHVPELLKTLFGWRFATDCFLLLGVWAGRSLNIENEPTCETIRTKMVKPWESMLISSPSQMLVGGLLPFMAIFRHMDEMFASLLLKKDVCGAYNTNTVLIDLIIVISVTIWVAVLFSIYQLSKEDFNWWWRSVLRGGSTAIFMFGYGIYFYRRLGAPFSPNLVVYMSYNASLFYAIFMALGTISFCASLFVYQCMYERLHRLDPIDYIHFTVNSLAHHLLNFLGYFSVKAWSQMTCFPY